MKDTTYQVLMDNMELFATAYCDQQGWDKENIGRKSLINANMALLKAALEQRMPEVRE